MPFEGKEGRDRRLCALGLFIAAAGACTSQPSFAQTAELDPIVVIGEGRDTMQAPGDAAGFSDVIYTEDAWRGFTTVAELLEHAVGVQVNRSGAREDFASISVRGSSAGQVKILLDGVNLSRAQTQVVNLAELPLDRIERIEIYRGFAPVDVAGPGAASVVRIVTKTPEAASYGGAVGYGSFDTAKAAAHASTPTRLGLFSANLGLRRSSGDFSFRNDNGTPEQAADDFGDRRRNNEHASLDAGIGLRREAADGSTLRLRNDFYSKDEGVPGLGAFQSEHASLRLLRNIVSAVWENADGSLGAGWDLTYRREVFRDPLCPGCTTLGFGYERAENRSLATALRANGEHPIGSVHLLQGSVEAAHERFRGEVSAPSAPESRQRRNSAALAVGDEMVFASGRLFVVPQLRHQVLWNRFDSSTIPFFQSGMRLPSKRVDSTDPRLGLRLEAGRGITLKANGGTYFRPPSFAEEFGDSGSTKANPELRPEQGTSADAGIRWQHRGRGARRINVEYAYFMNDAEDLIVFVQTAQRVAKAQNVGEARVRGHELRLESTLPAGLAITANLTRQRAENLGPAAGERVPGLPETEVFAELSWRRETEHGAFSVSYDIGYKGERFFDEDNRRRAPSQTVHGASFAGRPPRSQFEARLELENFGNERAADLAGFPVPGRAMYLTLSYAGGDDE